MPENQLSEQILHQEFWENRWLEAKAGSTIYSRLNNRQKWIEYWNSISGSYSRHMCCERNIANSIIELMRYEGIIGKDSAVLDIGCGPGTFALPMSPSVSSIVALDPAEMMLDLLLQEAKQKSLTNISPVCTTWEDTDYSKDFDLVLAAFSTCINEADMLKKMNEASRKYACLIGFFKTEEKVLRDELWREIMGTPFQSSTLNLIYPLNLLLTAGYRPNLKFFKYSYEQKSPIEQLVLRHKSFFNLFIDVDGKTEEKISRYFQTRSKDGTFITQISREICVMWWETIQ